MRMVPAYEAVAIPFVAQLFDAERRLRPTEFMEASAGAMLDELWRLREAQRALRRPAASSDHRPITMGP